MPLSWNINKSYTVYSEAYILLAIKLLVCFCFRKFSAILLKTFNLVFAFSDGLYRVSCVNVCTLHFWRQINDLTQSREKAERVVIQASLTFITLPSIKGCIRNNIYWWICYMCLLHQRYNDRHGSESLIQNKPYIKYWPKIWYRHEFYFEK